MCNPVIRGTIAGMLLIASIYGMEPNKPIATFSEELFLKKLTAYLAQRKKMLITMLKAVEDERIRLQPYLDYKTDQIDDLPGSVFIVHEIRSRTAHGSFCKRGLTISAAFLSRYHALLGKDDENSYRSLKITKDFLNDHLEELTQAQREYLSFVDRNFVTLFNSDTKKELRQGTIVSDRGKIDRAFSNCIAFNTELPGQHSPQSIKHRSSFSKPRPDSPVRLRSHTVVHERTSPSLTSRDRSKSTSSECSSDRKP